MKGRILLNLNRPADAAAAVASVPTSYAYKMYYEAMKADNAIWSYNNSARRYSVSTNEGTNGLNFATAGDPRLPVCTGGDAVCKANGVTINQRDDKSAFPIYVQLKWPVRDASVTIVGGVEARLIEAEAAYKAGNPALMVQKLNQARTEGGVTGLAANLTDPGTNSGARRPDLPRARLLALLHGPPRRRPAPPDQVLQPAGGQRLPDGHVAQGWPVRHRRQLPRAAGRGDEPELPAQRVRHHGGVMPPKVSS